MLGCSLGKLLADDDDDDDIGDEVDDVEGDNDAVSIDAGGDSTDGATFGEGCSSTARARFKTLAMCSCSS